MTRLSQQEIIRRVKNADDSYEVVGDYIRLDTPLMIRHIPCGYEWAVNLKRFFAHDKNRGSICPKCSDSHKRAAIIKTHEHFKKEINERFGDKISVVGKYVQPNIPVDFHCKECDKKWKANPNIILKTKYGCPECTAKISLSNDSHINTGLNGIKFIQNILDINKIKYRLKVSFPDLLTYKYAAKPIFDFGLVDDRGRIIKLIEIENPSSSSLSFKEGFMENQIVNESKSFYAINNGIPLLRIPYSEVSSFSKDRLLKDVSFEKELSVDLLAFDQATTSGVSIWNNKTLLDCFSHTLPKTGNQNLPYFQDFVLKMIRQYSPKKIVLEDVLGLDGEPSKKSKHTLQQLCFFMGIIISACEQYNIPYEIIIASAWKKTLGVKGIHRREQKQSCMEIINSMFTLDTANSEDVCDAIGIGYHALHETKAVKEGDLQWK